jgi:hypothetical protein
VSSFYAFAWLLLRLGSVLFCCVLSIALSSFSHGLAKVNFRVRLPCFGVDFGATAAFENKLESAHTHPPVVA